MGKTQTRPQPADSLARILRVWCQVWIKPCTAARVMKRLAQRRFLSLRSAKLSGVRMGDVTPEAFFQQARRVKLAVLFCRTQRSSLWAGCHEPRQKRPAPPPPQSLIFGSAIPEGNLGGGDLLSLREVVSMHRGGGSNSFAPAGAGKSCHGSVSHGSRRGLKAFARYAGC